MVSRMRRAAAEPTVEPLEEPGEDATPEQWAEYARAFKNRATERFHAYAQSQGGWCSTYDQVMVKVGLRPRPDMLGVDLSEFEPKGETSREEFQEWLRRASRTLHSQARRSGISTDYNDVLREVGFPPRERVEVVLAGTFELEPLEVWRNEGDAIITGVDEHTVAQRLYDAVVRGSETVQWKATVAGAEVEFQPTTSRDY